MARRVAHHHPRFAMKACLAAAFAGVILLAAAAAPGLAPRAATPAISECKSLVWADCNRVLGTLARFADAAYGGGSTAPPPPGFRPADLAGAALVEGRYTNGAATALAMTASLDETPVLVVGFGGSADPSTWLADLRDIDAPYRQFLPLVRAIERYVAGGGKVVLVGHSFGGAMVQLFMFNHPGDDHYRAVTFGSPGALPRPGVFAARADARIANVAIADDPYVFLGEHRADVAAYALRNRLYGFALANGIARESGLSTAQVVGSAAYLTANYVNNGPKIILSSARPILSVPTVLAADPDEHNVKTYVTRFGFADG